MTVKAIYCSDSEGGMKMVFSRLKMTNPTSEVFVACQWFEENGELKEAIFEEEMLEKAVK